MGQKEKELINEVLLKGTKHGRLFRGNAGKAWQGKIGFSGPGKILLTNPRVFHGLSAGFPDVFGWETKTLCEIIKEKSEDFPCMQENLNDGKDCKLCKLNRKIAIFEGVECKTGKQKLSIEQKRFKKQLLKDGGIYEEKREK